MANKIQIKRGLESNINKSNLLQGELAVTTDSNKLYVGTSKGPIQLNKDDESLVIIDYYETDESKKEKIKSLFIKEDGAPSEYQLVKPCILLAPTVEPTSTTSIYTKGQWICAFGDTESNLINELTNERAITKYDLIFMTVNMGLNLIYNVSEDTITYTWMENVLEATYNKITKIGTPETINDKHYPSEKAVYDYVNEKAVQSDYNQNDSTASDYIKNRPFYEISNIIFQGDVTFTKDGEFEVYSGIVPFSTSFKKDDFKKVWRLQILYEEKQEKLRRYSWDYENGQSNNYSWKYENGQSNNFEYFSYFISSQGMAEVYWNGAHIVSSDTALKIDIPADGDTASTKTINITITMQTKSDTLDLMSLKDIEDIIRVLQGNSPR